MLLLSFQLSSAVLFFFSCLSQTTRFWSSSSHHVYCRWNWVFCGCYTFHCFSKSNHLHCQDCIDMHAREFQRMLDLPSLHVANSGRFLSKYSLWALPATKASADDASWTRHAWHQSVWHVRLEKLHLIQLNWAFCSLLRSVPLLVHERQYLQNPTIICSKAYIILPSTVAWTNQLHLLNCLQVLHFWMLLLPADTRRESLQKSLQVCILQTINGFLPKPKISIILTSSEEVKFHTQKIRLFLYQNPKAQFSSPQHTWSLSYEIHTPQTTLLSQNPKAQFSLPHHSWFLALWNSHTTDIVLVPKSTDNVLVLKGKSFSLTESYLIFKVWNSHTTENVVVPKSKKTQELDSLHLVIPGV